jgi:curli biogenesis system outer membrane secretion channel CsgG/peptidoglycan hydrolase-like protein with peptidoglycan-binding domain
MGEMMQNPGEPTTKTVSTTQPTLDQAQLEPYDGPKARVAVYQFGDRSAKGRGAGYGGYPGFGWYNPQIGDGMADMLSDGLLQSNRFIVLDRQAIKDVLQEQDLAAAGRISRETAAPIGQVEGADLLVKGSVTEFEPGSAGAGAGAGLGFFGLPGALLGGVLGGMRQSHVAMIVQVVDARTSRVLFSTTVEGKANDFDLGGALAGFGGNFAGGVGLGGWQKTPVEKAIRIAILQAVKELSSKTPQTYFRHGTGAAPAVPGPIASRATATAPAPISSPRPPEVRDSSLVVDSQRIREAQEMLQQLGFDPGAVDGVAGARTRAAIAQFQSATMRSKEASGRLDEATYGSLKSAVADKYAAPRTATPPTPASASAGGDMPSNVFVNVSRATLFDTPGSAGKSVATVTQGAKLAVQADDKDSYFVVIDGGTKGWINKALTRR